MLLMSQLSIVQSSLIPGTLVLCASMSLHEEYHLLYTVCSYAKPRVHLLVNFGLNHAGYQWFYNPNTTLIESFFSSDKATQLEISLLNCDPRSSETLKELVFGEGGSVTVFDGSDTAMGHLQNILLGDESNLGKSKGKCVCLFVHELTDAVKATLLKEYPEGVLLETNISFCSQSTIVIVLPHNSWAIT